MTDKAPKRLKLWDDLGRNWGCNCSFISVLKIGVKDTNSKLPMQSVEEFSVLSPSTKTSLQSRRYTRQTLLLWGSVWCSECGCCDLKKENMHNWNISTFSPSPRVTFYLCSSTWLVFSTSCGRTWNERSFHVRSFHNKDFMYKKARGARGKNELLTYASSRTRF